MNKSEYFQKVKELVAEEDTNVAANAIRKCIATFIKFDLCSLEEFLCLIDLDYQDYWKMIADNIASGAEREIRNGNLHPNDLKPWQNCSDYKVQFNKLSTQKEWRELHSAINTIIEHISIRFSC